MWPALSRGFLAVGIALTLSANAAALPFDHLIMGKVNGGSKVDYVANLDAVYDALDGTGCRAIGSPRTMLVPVTRSNTNPPDPNDIPSVILNAAAEDQVFVCYNLRCPDPQPLVGPFQDNFASHFSLSLAKNGRLLCVPGIPW